MVAEDYRGGDFIDVLRNASSVMQAGATMLSGLSGDVKIPRKSTASAAAWISTEGGNAANSEPTFGQVALSAQDTRRIHRRYTFDDDDAVVFGH